NDLSYLDTNTGLLLKVIDLDPDLHSQNKDEDHLIPSQKDKENYKTQFRAGDTKGAQLIKVISKFFRISSLGLTANLDYVSPLKDDTLQKLYQEIVYSRDKYIEAQHL